MKHIGITTTVPAEILIAAGYKMTDLNNVFVGSGQAAEYINYAENRGFPKNTCTWIKGLFGVCMQNNIKEIAGVVEGDCSNSRALLSVFREFGIKVYPFAYPHDRRQENVKASIQDFMKQFGVSLNQAEKVRSRLSSIRALARRIDELTYRDGKATGFENHLLQIGLSDFGGDESECERVLLEKVAEIEARMPQTDLLRLGFIGVPPMMADIFDYVEERGARFVYNEVQREFAFPRAELAGDIFEQYRDYTYPYDIDFRLTEMRKQIAERKLTGIIHYVQSFCHRAIDDIILKRTLDLPVMTIEGDRSDSLDMRTKLRLDAFIDMLQDRRSTL